METPVQEHLLAPRPSKSRNAGANAPKGSIHLERHAGIALQVVKNAPFPVPIVPMTREKQQTREVRSCARKI
jgi:hypothetical protein